MKIPHKTLERSLFRAGYPCVIGVDEVGMGCLAGPVTVCAVLLTPSFYRRRHRNLQWLRDSKMLRPHQRTMYARRLMAEPLLKYRVVSASPATIDRMNIYQAARHAMRRAIRGVTMRHQRGMVLVDGRGRIEGIRQDQTPVVKGDRKVFAIACASIIAKVYRDALMERMAKRYPGYGLEIHKGYATKLHRARLAELGPSPLHRRSFRSTVTPNL